MRLYICIHVYIAIYRANKKQYTIWCDVLYKAGTHRLRSRVLNRDSSVRAFRLAWAVFLKAHFPWVISLKSSLEKSHLPWPQNWLTIISSTDNLVFRVNAYSHTTSSCCSNSPIAHISLWQLSCAYVVWPGCRWSQSGKLENLSSWSFRPHGIADTKSWNTNSVHASFGTAPRTSRTDIAIPSAVDLMGQNKKPFDLFWIKKTKWFTGGVVHLSGRCFAYLCLPPFNS